MLDISFIPCEEGKQVFQISIGVPILKKNIYIFIKVTLLFI